MHAMVASLVPCRRLQQFLLLLCAGVIKLLLSKGANTKLQVKQGLHSGKTALDLAKDQPTRIARESTLHRGQVMMMRMARALLDLIIFASASAYLHGAGLIWVWLVECGG